MRNTCSELSVPNIPELIVRATCEKLEPMVHDSDTDGRKAFALRLNEALRRAGYQEWGAAARLARAVVPPVSPRAASKWINGEAIPDTKRIEQLSGLLGVSGEWLLTGRGAITVRDQAARYSLDALSPWDDSTPMADDEVAIPFFKEVELAAGAGASHAVELNHRKLRFSRATLAACGVDDANAACATLRGNSMERLISDGSTIGIDRGRTEIRDGEIYAIDHEGMLRVKYLYRLPGGALRLRSENVSEYPDEILTADQAAAIRVLGWVFWWSTIRTWKGR